MFNLIIPLAGPNTIFKFASLNNKFSAAQICVMRLKTRCWFQSSTKIIFVLSKQDPNSEIFRDEVLIELPGATCFFLDSYTEGVPQTLDKVIQSIEIDDDPIIIDYLDFDFEIEISKMVSFSSDPHLMACLLYFESIDPTHSYIKMNPDSRIVQVVEKTVISVFASVGVYIFRNLEELKKVLNHCLVYPEISKVGSVSYLAPGFNIYRLGKNFALGARVGSGRSIPK